MSASIATRDLSKETPTRRRLTRKRVALAGAAVVLLGAAAWYGERWWTEGRFIESTDDAYVGGNVTALASHVPGYIAAVLVQDNQHVEAGQVLVQLDRSDYEAAEARTAAVVASRRATLDSLHAEAAEQQSIIRRDEADLTSKAAQASFTVQDATRYRDLAQRAAGSQQEAQRSAALDQQAKASVSAAGSALQAAHQHLAVLTANIARAEADVRSAEAELRTARLNLQWTEIRAPVSGFVGNRLAQVGAYAGAGGYVISVIPDAGLWVDANFKEDQLAHMRPGQPATVAADIIPGHPFHGHVVSVAPGTGSVFSVIPPENATGNFTKIVQRVPVRIALDAGDATLPLLRPGLSTTTGVDIRHE